MVKEGETLAAKARSSPSSLNTTLTHILVQHLLRLYMFPSPRSLLPSVLGPCFQLLSVLYICVIYYICICIYYLFIYTYYSFIYIYFILYTLYIFPYVHYLFLLHAHACTHILRDLKGRPM